MRFACNDFTEGYFKLNNWLFFTPNAYDHERGGVTAHKFDVTMVSESPACGLNLHDLNYTMNKWKMLNNLYLDTQALGTMIARIQHYMGEKKHKTYIPDIAMQFKARRNVSGACLLNITLGFHNDRWVSCITSRASELTCRWPMDLIFVNVLLKTISEALDIEFEDIQVIWHMVSTYQSITSMPYFLVFAGKENWFDTTDPKDMTEWQLYTYKRYMKCYRGDHYSNYGVQRRPMEAYRMLKGQMERKQLVYTEDLSVGVVNDIDSTLEADYDEVDLLCLDPKTVLELAKQANEDDSWGKGGYR